MYLYQIGSTFFFSSLCLSLHSGFCLELGHAGCVGREDYLETSQSGEDHCRPHRLPISSHSPSGYSINTKSHHGNNGGVYHIIYLLKYPLASSPLSAFLFRFSLDYTCIIAESYVVCAAPSTKPILSSRE